MITPTVGRIVWFWDALNSPHGQPMAAIVSYVHSDRMVNLSVTNPNGVPFPKTSVELVQEDGVAPQHGFYCEWMPYQKGQAAKTEAAEAKADPRKVQFLKDCGVAAGAAGALVKHHDEEQADHRSTSTHPFGG